MSLQHGAALLYVHIAAADVVWCPACTADLLLAGAGPGGPYEDTLLLVMSDHGQTLGGDHGGGSSDEVDSILLAANLQKMHKVVRTSAGATGEQFSGFDMTLQHLHSSSCKHELKTGNSSGSSDSSSSSEAAAGSGEDGTAGASSTCSGASFARACVCASSIPQIDFTPTVSHLLGLPVPFGNLGKVPALLWAVLAETDEAHEGEANGCCGCTGRFSTDPGNQ